MNEGENKTLLQKSDNRTIGSSFALGNEKHEDDDHDWWASDSGSSSGSYYSDTGSSAVEWESEIGPTGEVFYIESQTDTFIDSQKSSNDRSESPPPELTRRRSTRAGKLMRLIKRRESKRYSVRNKKSTGTGLEHAESQQQKGGNGSKEVTFRDSQAGEIRYVTLLVDPDKKHKLGRRATLCEAYLGITPSTFSDKVRVMVAGFISDGEAIRNKSIKIGDWLKSINSREVTFQNLEHILSGISAATNIRLELQRVTGIEVTTSSPITNSPKQSVLVRQLVNKEEVKVFMESLLDLFIGVIYLKTTGLSETGPELQGVLYSFPCSQSVNTQTFLCTARGAFITLNHMLPGMTGPPPISTSVSLAGEIIHIIYTTCGDDLFLMAVPDKRCSLLESIELSGDIVRALEFNYETLSKCFTTKDIHPALDHFFALLFFRLINGKKCPETNDSYENIVNLRDELISLQKCEFENFLSAAHLIQLPRDAQIQIDAALNEMEAMDYRDWNEDPMDCQRLYTILGSCLYHKNYLLGSHLAHEDLIVVHSFLRQNGLLHLVKNEPVKSLIIFRQVYPPSCTRKDTENEACQLLGSGKKWFLLVVGYGYELLAVLLESGGCTASHIENTGPDIFYVEEAQETLKHIQKIGISTLVGKWISANARPEVISVEDRIAVKTSSSIAENLLGLIKSSDAQSTFHKMTPNSTVTKKTPEVASILKKRSPEQSPIMSGSVYSLQMSEDSISQGTGAISEISDEAAPILGRRATRERNNATSKNSEDSDSDVDMYRNDCQVGTMDISDIRENLLNQAEYIVPKKLTSGEKNVLFHYIHLDMLEGILLSSETAENSLKNAKILTNFNRCAHIIHKLLHNTVRFKKMLSQDMDKSVINKSLIAIKEHGVLFEWDSLSYWVIGRLYTTPHPKELYVCYQDTAPQNLVEMAFRLNSMWN
ncbi:protein inturned [Cephus cinctus]|uniref:Protein inturned n=1 Tax=Cephus cinctus TaxID=211228 RepID=A0AAJ7C1T7_CEPCN|nr:protein inturned [Cephus cinctus]